MIQFLYRKLSISLFVSLISFFLIFFVFSTLNNLSNAKKFIDIISISLINSLQIINYVPSVIFIVAIFFLTTSFKSSNELVIIKSYFNKNLLVLAMMPFFFLFSFLEVNKIHTSNILQKTISDLSDTNKNNEIKVLIENEANKKIYNVFKGVNFKDETFSEFLRYETNKDQIDKSIFSKKFELNNKNIILKSSIYYDEDTFAEQNSTIILNYSFLDLLNDNLVIYKNPKSKLSINEIIILVNKYLSSIVFYLIIFLLFFSKKNTNKNSLRVSLIYSIIFLIYFLIISNIHLANFQLLFMTSISLIFILLFFKFFINE